MILTQTVFLQTTTGDQNIVDPNIIGDFHVDMRLSANSISAENITLNNVAAAIVMKDDNWIFDIGDAQTLGGNIIAKLGERTENEKTTVISRAFCQRHRCDQLE